MKFQNIVLLLNTTIAFRYKDVMIYVAWFRYTYYWYVLAEWLMTSYGEFYLCFMTLWYDSTLDLIDPDIVVRAQHYFTRVMTSLFSVELYRKLHRTFTAFCNRHLMLNISLSVPFQYVAARFHPFVLTENGV